MYDLEWMLSQPFRENPFSRLYRLSAVKEDGCIEYLGSKDQYGYGRFKIGGKNLGAHKVSYVLHVGDYDQDTLELGHTCDNPSCINPTHLRPITHADNIQECVDKGRHSSHQPWFHKRLVKVR